MSEYRKRVSGLLEDKSASEWIKRTIIVLNGRDIVDALNELEVLQELLMLKFEEAVVEMRAKGKLA